MQLTGLLPFIVAVALYGPVFALARWLFDIGYGAKLK
jgi:hypothetical protein